MTSRTLRFILCVIVAALVGYYVGITKIAFDMRHFTPPQFASKEPPSNLQNVDFTPFWTVYQELEAKFYDRSALDQKKLLNGAISGMVDSLDDPFTMYLPPTQNNNFKQQMSGQFEGIGAELGLNGKQIVVIAPLDDSPALKAGIKAADQVIKVNGESTVGWDLNKTVDKIRGQKGTIVTLAVIHKDQTKPQDVKITRDAIQVKSVTSYTKEIKDIAGVDAKTIGGDPNTKVAYIRLSQFGDDTNQEWQPIVNKISTEMLSDKSIKGVVLDIRNNPGGLLSDAVFIASEFIDNGVVVREEGPTVPDSEKETDVNRKGLLTTVPLVVLVNKGTASASEILSGALRDHQRGTLVGDTTFGKGIVQEADELGGGAGIHVTIAKWLTPNGTWVGNGKDGSGLKPDVQVGLDTKDQSHDLQLEKGIETLLGK